MMEKPKPKPANRALDLLSVSFSGYIYKTGSNYLLELRSWNSWNGASTKSVLDGRLCIGVRFVAAQLR